ncbi:hypothetical protein [Paenibacillus oleatilyticus]|uniref:hypothetical protein n=1 Tax=Paenibacillus oleatilyticus TaxID=2594886 RepID=UPI001C1F4F5F|nr:hypothetical protein [Paenibacillus oleatilyticus]MBU7316082.1 hypothetical protein [Paenibacillus oleatilyticus]
MSITEFAENVLGFQLTSFQKDLLMILQNDSDYIKYVKKKSHTMVQVLDVYDRWKNSIATI